MAWIVPMISSFLVSVPSSSAWSGGAVPWFGVDGSPVIFRWREPIVFRVWGRNWRPVVPGVYYPDSSPEPSVEQVVRAGHSTVGGTGTHMVLWVVQWDSEVRLQG
jgi:hypothetical protein